jgi:hypothetical protein
MQLTEEPLLAREEGPCVVGVPLVGAPLLLYPVSISLPAKYFITTGLHRGGTGYVRVWPPGTGRGHIHAGGMTAYHIYLRLEAGIATAVSAGKHG